MTTIQITRASDVLTIWPFFAEGLQMLVKTSGIYYEELQAKKMICKLATEPCGYVAVCYSDEGEPLSFCVAQEDTIPFAKDRTFTARAVYYRQGHSKTLLSLMGAFEGWCRANRIRRYSIIVRRQTTAAKRCFQHEQFAFKKMCLIFEKDL
jgi:hypothetical protein